MITLTKAEADELIVKLGFQSPGNSSTRIIKIYEYQDKMEPDPTKMHKYQCLLIGESPTLGIGTRARVYWQV